MKRLNLVSGCVCSMDDVSRTPVYHGSPLRFESFNDSPSGIFFSEDPRIALEYAGHEGFLYRCFVQSDNAYETTGEELDAGEGMVACEAFNNGHDAFLVKYPESFDIAVFSGKNIHIEFCIPASKCEVTTSQVSVSIKNKSGMQP